MTCSQYSNLPPSDPCGAKQRHNLVVQLSRQLERLLVVTIIVVALTSNVLYHTLVTTS